MAVKRVQLLNENGDVENVILVDTAQFPLADYPLPDGWSARLETKTNAGSFQPQAPAE
jgi:hypothetical protein